MCATPLGALEMPEIGLLILAGVVCIPLFWIVHRALNRICFAHVKRYCRTHDIDVSGWRLFPSVDQRGTKTENTQIEVLSSGPEGGQKVYRFIVWVFGIRSVGESPFNPNPEEAK